MIMIDVLNKLAKGEIKAQTELFVYDHIECIDIYTFDGKAFYNERNEEIGSNFIISGVFLNYIVELIPPSPNKYLIKFNMPGLDEEKSYLNYRQGSNHSIIIYGGRSSDVFQTQFTKAEMYYIEPLRDCLFEMNGKYELIGVDENEIN